MLPPKKQITGPAPIITLVEVDPVIQLELDASKKRIDKLTKEKAEVEATWKAKQDALAEKQQRQLLIQQKV